MGVTIAYCIREKRRDELGLILLPIRALGYVDATAGSKNDGIMNILEVGHEVFRGPDENNSNVSGSGCEDSVGETCLVSCGDMRSAFRKQDRDRLSKEIACSQRGFKDTTLVSSLLWKKGR